MLGREASRTLQQHGAMAVGPGGLVNLQQRGSERFAELWTSLRGSQAVLWFDNYVRPRSFVDPARGFHMFDCTVYAVLRMPTLQLPLFRGMPELGDLFSRRRVLVRDLMEYQPVLLDMVEAVRQMALGPNDVRVPLDVVRVSGRSPEWSPFAVSASCVTTQSGLLHALGWSVELANHSVCPMPICVDENIHYRLLKLCYGENTHRYNVRSQLNKCPPLYGVWHAYKYVVSVIHRAYYAHFIYLLQGEVEVGRTFPSSKRIRSIEMMMAGLLQLRSTLKEELHQAIVAAAVDERRAATPATKVRLKNLLALKALLDVYVPVAFVLGWQARNCVWGHRLRGSGSMAKEVVMGCLLVLLQLTEGQSHLVEYVRTMMCALICWTSWHSEVPGVCYTDEANEASLAQLGRWWAQHAEVTTATSLMSMFLMMPVMGRDVSEARVTRPSGELLSTMEHRLRALLRSPREVVTYVPWTLTRVCVSEDTWPVDAWFPGDLGQMSATYLTRLSKYVLSKLVVQSAVTVPVDAALRRLGLVHRRDAETLQQDAIIRRIKEDCPVDMVAARVTPPIGQRLGL